ncbi:multidrug transporter [Histoplasma capsulatum H143]|uniref:Multidrug transporter n=1 Tax=Ajellomyces capsulatus (strain H143) TaxID=544712 RepID=C6HH86_AJECH|nr:multidrug transporter [Histoplasma capsulatum H143]
MTTDMREPKTKALRSRSAIGPIFGAFIEYSLSWQLIFWVQLIFGGVVQLAHFFLVGETRSTVIIDREAKRRRKAGEDPSIYGPNELKKHRINFKKILTVWIRPFHMLVCEPIVLFLSLLSGFSDALIFTWIKAFALGYSQWGFGMYHRPWSIRTFIPIIIGYLVSYPIFLPDIETRRKLRKSEGDSSRTAGDVSCFSSTLVL